MSIIYLLLSVSILVAVVFFVAFIVSVRNGQYDDTYTPSVRMLFDDELTPSATPAAQSAANKITTKDTSTTKVKQ